jgi:hypothetical protein
LKTLARITALAASVVLIAGVAPANAAPADNVSIQKIAKVKLKNKTKAKVAPKVKTGPAVQVVSKTLTVKKGNKTVAKNKNAVSLKAGTYRVTTTVKYKVQQSSTALVSDGTTAIPMSCVVTGTELNNVEGYDVTLMFLDCTGAFDGVYKARMAYVNDPFLRSLVGDNIWGDSFLEHPNSVPAVTGTRFAATVKPVDVVLYKTTQTLSGVKSKKASQSLKVVR